MDDDRHREGLAPRRSRRIYLLPNAFTPRELGEVLNGFKRSRWYGAVARMQVRAFWNSRFNARQVYGALAHELTQ